MRLIVGLGNPGKDYEWTRHNLGFLVVRRLAEKLKLKFALSSLTNGMAAEGIFEEDDICLLAPLTYMNNSGVAISRLMSKKDLSTEDILVVCDDFHLDFEQVRLRAKGSDGGHNGLSSVIEHLGTEQFARLRMGIDYPPGKKDTVDYVLEEFKKKEKDRLDGFIDEAVSCCLMWLKEGTNAAMDQHNRRK
ncbi:MAG: aminoacyl-tRNA hydrolase [Candidatus Omnitrophica bacterium]|nr:aminoacyl-tRNA hydrolase [Candidatus Omnitrophota bacterium]